MHFQFFLGNHSRNSFVMLEDLVRPLVVGLQESGHHVVSYGTIAMAPAVNVFVEFFPDRDFVDQLIALKTQLREKFLFGIVCTEDLEDPYIWQLSVPGRRDNLLRLMAHADFLWTIVPPASYQKLYPAERVAHLRYGHSHRLRPACGIADAGHRDIDVLVYGSPYKYRMPLADELRVLGLICEFTVRTARNVQEGWPRYLADELLSSAKVVVDMRRGTEVRYASVTRIAAAVHSGCAVVAEAFDTSEMASLYRYTTPAAYQELAATCRRIIDAADYVERGVGARDLFCAETSMRHNMAVALDLPVFRQILG